MRDLTETNRNLVGVIVETALTHVGMDIHNLVEQRLSDDYHCKFEDCYENPEYLARILRDVYGDCYDEIVKSIKKGFKNIVFDEKLTEFIKVIST